MLTLDIKPAVWYPQPRIVEAFHSD